MATRAESETTSARDFLPQRGGLPALRKAAQDCRGCPLYEPATQTVFGEGPPRARIMLVGEQPGHEEDLDGRPFVGPAGRLLNRLLDEAALDRSQVYLTNAVKHFKFEQRGKRRLHKPPNRSEIVACRAWLESELAVVQPRVVVALGATAAGALFGPSFRLTKQRGTALPTQFCPNTMATFHPSALLRSRDRPDAKERWQAVVDDLQLARQIADGEAA